MTEHQLQVTVAQYLDCVLAPPAFWTSVDAGVGKLSQATAWLRKRRGVKKGLPDIFVFHPTGTGACVVVGIELKSPTGRLSAAQREMAGTLMAAGIRCCLARSVEEVEGILRHWGIPLRATAGLRLARAAA